MLPGRLVLERTQEYCNFIDVFVGVALVLDVVLGARAGTMSTIMWGVASRIARHGAASVLGDLFRGTAAVELRMKVRE